MRNPVVGEFMRRIVMIEARFVRYKLRIIGVTLSLAMRLEPPSQ